MSRKRGPRSQQGEPTSGRERASGRPSRQTGSSGGRDRSTVLIHGFHPVREALRSTRRDVVRLWGTQAAVDRLAADLAQKPVPVDIVSAADLAERLGGEAVHGGVLAEARPLPDATIDDLPPGLVLVLDQITDPHNVGAIVRTAAAFGAVGLVMTERHAPALSGIVAKAASGGLEHVPVVSVVNLARALDDLGDQGFLRIGLDSAGEADLGTVALSLPLALVLGAEGSGLRHLTRQRCDLVARIDLPGAIKSLNVSNACAVALTVVRAKLATPG